MECHHYEADMRHHGCSQSEYPRLIADGNTPVWRRTCSTKIIGNILEGNPRSYADQPMGLCGNTHPIRCRCSSANVRARSRREQRLCNKSKEETKAIFTCTRVVLLNKAANGNWFQQPHVQPTTNNHLGTVTECWRHPSTIPLQTRKLLYLVLRTCSFLASSRTRSSLSRMAVFVCCCQLRILIVYVRSYLYGIALTCGLSELLTLTIWFICMAAQCVCPHIIGSVTSCESQDEILITPSSSARRLEDQPVVRQ